MKAIAIGTAIAMVSGMTRITVRGTIGTGIGTGTGALSARARFGIVPS